MPVQDPLEVLRDKVTALQIQMASVTSEQRIIRWIIGLISVAGGVTITIVTKN